MKHIYVIMGSDVAEATEKLDDENIDYEFDGDNFTVDDEYDAQFQMCLMDADIDFRDATDEFISDDTKPNT